MLKLPEDEGLTYTQNNNHLHTFQLSGFFVDPQTNTAVWEEYNSMGILLQTHKTLADVEKAIRQDYAMLPDYHFKNRVRYYPS